MQKKKMTNRSLFILLWWAAMVTALLFLLLFSTSEAGAYTFYAILFFQSIPCWFMLRHLFPEGKRRNIKDAALMIFYIQITTWVIALIYMWFIFTIYADKFG